MEKRTFSIPNISCNHCVNNIRNELAEMEGVKSVIGDPHAREITVEWEEPASLERIRETLKEIDYPATT